MVRSPRARVVVVFAIYVLTIYLHFHDKPPAAPGYKTREEKPI
jgi:hypothetical protein